MKDNHFRLSEKTALIAGPLSPTTTSICSFLTELGADVALVDRNVGEAERFADQLNNQKEIHPEFGRAHAFEADLTKAHHVQEALNKVSESFGGIDIYVDALSLSQPQTFNDDLAMEEVDRLINVNLKAPLLMSHSIFKTLLERRRGRMIFLLNDLHEHGYEKDLLGSTTRSGLKALIRGLAGEGLSAQVTINGLALGPTEEGLRQLHPESQAASLALNKLKERFPKATMVEPMAVAQVVGFLASPMSSGINGQIISINNGTI